MLLLCFASFCHKEKAARPISGVHTDTYSTVQTWIYCTNTHTHTVQESVLWFLLFSAPDFSGNKCGLLLTRAKPSCGCKMLSSVCLLCSFERKKESDRKERLQYVCVCKMWQAPSEVGVSNVQVKRYEC